MRLEPGSKLGPYEILSAIGAGGMGEVYRARDSRLDRIVAVKVLPAVGSGDADRKARFDREARAISRLSHPNICTLHDVGHHDGIDYIVMEHLEGETLAARLARGPLPIETAMRHAVEIADALARAHRLGIVHRDLKPGNVMLTKSGAKLLDFGLAKVVAAPAAGLTDLPTREAGDAPLTDSGTVLGTVQYMAPEQLEGREADARSDIFAFGVLVYEMVTGRRAFTARSQASLIAAILTTEPPPLAAAQPLSPPALERVVRRCLAKDPDARWQNADDLADELRWIASGASTSGVAAISPAPLERPRRFPIAALLALVAASAAAAFFVGQKSGTGGAVSGAPSAFHRLTFRRGNVLHARFSSGGQTIVYGASWEGRPTELFEARADGREGRPLGLTGADILAVSKTGELAILRKSNFLGALSGSGMLARVPLSGGAPRDVLDGVSAADWDPDGVSLAVVRVVNERPRVEYPVGHVVYESKGGLGWVRVSPGGDKVAFFEFDDDAGTLTVVDRAGKVYRLGEPSRYWDSFAWAPSGDELLLVAGPTREEGTLSAVSLDGQTRLIMPTTGVLSLHDVSADGRLLLEREVGRYGLAAGTADGERELSWFDQSSVRDISDDGRTLLFDETGEAESGAPGVYVRATDGSPAVRLGNGIAQGLSSDGKWVLALTPGPSGTLVLLPTGAGEPRPVPTEVAHINGAGLMPNGRIVYAGGRDARSTTILAQDADGGNRHVTVGEGILTAAISPDSRFLAVVRASDRTALVYPIDGGTPRPLLGIVAGDRLIQWSADARFLYVWSRGRVPAPVDRVEIATGRRERWKELIPSDKAGVIRIDEIVMARDARAYAYGYLRMAASDLYVAKLPPAR